MLNNDSSSTVFNRYENSVTLTTEASNSEHFPPLGSNLRKEKKSKFHRRSWKPRAKGSITVITSDGLGVKLPKCKQANWYNFNLETELRNLPPLEGKVRHKIKQKSKPKVLKHSYFTPTPKLRSTHKSNPLRISDSDPEVYFKNQINNG